LQIGIFADNQLDSMGHMGQRFYCLFQVNIPKFI